MVLNTSEMWSNGIEIAFFSKNRPADESFAPRTPIASGSWGLCAQTPVFDTIELR